jgi:hypothetical protein
VALLVQGGLTVPMILLGTQPVWLWLLMPAPLVGFFGHIIAVVAATETATSEVPDSHKALATGLVTTSQRVAATVAIPLLGAVMAIRADLLAGIHLALAADVLLTLMAVIRAGLRRAGACEHRHRLISGAVISTGILLKGRRPTASDKPDSHNGTLAIAPPFNTQHSPITLI